MIRRTLKNVRIARLCLALATAFVLLVVAVLVLGGPTPTPTPCPCGGGCTDCPCDGNLHECRNDGCGADDCPCADNGWDYQCTYNCGGVADGCSCGCTICKKCRDYTCPDYPVRCACESDGGNCSPCYNTPYNRRCDWAWITSGRPCGNPPGGCPKDPCPGNPTCQCENHGCGYAAGTCTAAKCPKPGCPYNNWQGCGCDTGGDGPCNEINPCSGKVACTCSKKGHGCGCPDYCSKGTSACHGTPGTCTNGSCTNTTNCPGKKGDCNTSCACTGCEISCGGNTCRAQGTCTACNCDTDCSTDCDDVCGCCLRCMTDGMCSDRSCQEHPSGGCNCVWSGEYCACPCRG